MAYNRMYFMISSRWAYIQGGFINGGLNKRYIIGCKSYINANKVSSSFFSPKQSVSFLSQSLRSW